MSSTTPTTVVGFVARDVEVKRSQSGKNYVTVSVPHQRSRRGQDGQWENVGETTWHQATFYDDEADVVARSVSKGTKVVVTGTPEAYAFTAQDGSAGAAVRLLFPTLGVVPRVQRQQGGAPAGGQQGQGWPTQQPGQPGQQQGGGAQGQDVWSQPGTYDDETPF